MKVAVFIHQQDVPAAFQDIQEHFPLTHDISFACVGEIISVDGQHRVHPLGDDGPIFLGIKIIKAVGGHGAQLGGVGDFNISDPIIAVIMRAAVALLSDGYGNGGVLITPGPHEKLVFQRHAAGKINRQRGGFLSQRSASGQRQKCRGAGEKKQLLQGVYHAAKGSFPVRSYTLL